METERSFVEAAVYSTFQMEDDISKDNTNETITFHQLEDLPMYIRITVGILIILILSIGIIGNTMVALVITSSRDMRTSTNFFLVNLSVADLLVLLVITPTALLEVVYHPEMWLLGPVMCKVVPMLELLVCNASVLTILAISFERYYAICTPLKGLYVCTKGRAVKLCIIIWILAFVFTSPMLFMTMYLEILVDGGLQSRCYLIAGSFWPDLYTTSTIILLFLLPLFILLLTFRKIALKLTMDRSALNAKNEHQRAQQARGQVVLMLGTVVFTFFLCLIPFRLLTLVVLLTDYGSVLENHTEIFYTLSYFARCMTYINSALNPILYNIMSSKFRNGFKRLCRGKGKQFIFQRNGTFLTLTTGSLHITNATTTSTTMNNNMMSNNSTSASSPEFGISFIKKSGFGRKIESGSVYNSKSIRGLQSQTQESGLKNNQTQKSGIVGVGKRGESIL